MCSHANRARAAMPRLCASLVTCTYDARISACMQLGAAGADIHLRDEIGRTALIYAALNGHTAAVRELADRHADLNVSAFASHTAKRASKRRSVGRATSSNAPGSDRPAGCASLGPR